MNKKKRVLIVGGGIAGITLANILQKKDRYDVFLVEKRDNWKVSGTGFFIPSNGVIALKQLGLLNSVKQKSFIINCRKIFTSRGSLLMNLDLQTVWGKDRFSLGISRENLHNILVESLDETKISFGTTVEDLHFQKDFTKVFFSNGRADNFEIVIGADGIHSKIRELALGRVRIKNLSSSVCRFISNRPKNINCWTQFLDKKGQFIIIPISKEKVYCCVYHYKKLNLSKENFMDTFKNFTTPIPDILENWKIEDSYWGGIHRVKNMRILGRNRVVLVGDAAHGIPPALALGSSLAMEDALVVSKLLDEYDNWKRISSIFTRKRKLRLSWVRYRATKKDQFVKYPFWLQKFLIKHFGKNILKKDYIPLSLNIKY